MKPRCIWIPHVPEFTSLRSVLAFTESVSESIPSVASLTGCVVPVPFTSVSAFSQGSCVPFTTVTIAIASVRSTFPSGFVCNYKEIITQ